MLLVEDNETDRWFFSEVLRSRGNLVVACSSGEDALDTLGEGMPDLVMLDLQLPGLGGLEVCRQIRAHEGGSQPFVIIVTSSEEGETLGDVLEAGGDDFLKKPIEASSLVIRLEIAERRIHDRRRLADARKELISKSAELEALFNNLQEVFFSVDLDTGKLIQISPAAEQLFEMTMDELEAEERWREYVLPGDPLWTEAPNSDEPLHREYDVPARAGETKWIRASVRVHGTNGSGTPRVDGVLVDITKEREARDELGERNMELETIHRLAELSLSAESLDAAYGQMLDLISAAMGCPVVAIEHLDRDRDRLIMTAAKGISAFAEGPIEIPLHRTLSGVAVRTGRAVVEDDPGSRSEFSHETLVELKLRAFAAFPLMAAGAATGTLMLGSPEQVVMDERFERLGVSLATTVATYLERLEAEEAIRESEERFRTLATQLQEANQELESFAYSVSHDLRAPLRTMQGFAHALMQNYGSELSTEARDYAQRIIASGQQSERLISDLLAYSRLSFERLELMPVDLKAVIDQAREQVQADLEDTKAHLTIDDPLPTVRGNLTALVQVVANLLTNAVKFVPDQRKPEVRIRTEENDGMTRLWVEDNGVGIPEGQEERVFRVFERLAETGDRPGTGIGLAIVRRSMQRIGGDCGVRRLDQGSAFWIDIPSEQQGARVARRGW